MASHTLLYRLFLYRLFSYPLFPLWAIALVLPFLLWAVLAKLSRKDPSVLSRIYPGLKVLVFGLWIAMSMIWILHMGGHLPHINIFALSLVYISLYGGLVQMYHWVRRRINPDSYKKRET